MYKSDHKYCVYLHTSPSNKVYIGITGQKPTKRWQYGTGYDYNAHFRNAIKKYGWNGFKHEILFSGLDLDDAKKKEIELIEQYDSTNRDKGYNISPGGEMLSDETKAKIRETRKVKGTTKRESERMKAIWKDPEKRAEILRKMRSQPPRTAEQRRKYSEAARRRGPISEETKQKIRETHKQKVGENSIRKRAVCQIDPVDGSVVAIFPTARLAAASVGAPIGRISAVCRGRDYPKQFTKGFYWCWKDEYDTFVKTIELNPQVTANGKLKRNPEDNYMYGKHHSAETREKWKGRNGRKVMCVETGVVYESAAEAARYYGSPASVSMIRRQILGSGRVKTAFGHTWQYVEEDKEKWRGPNRRKVVCIETGVAYESLAEAARDYNSPGSAGLIGQQIRGERRIALGHTWKYEEENA